MECLNFKTVIRRGVGYALELIDNGATGTFDVERRAGQRRGFATGAFSNLPNQAVQ